MKSTTLRLPGATKHDQSIRVTVSDGEIHMGDTDWDHFAYRVTVTYQGRRMWFNYRTGIAHDFNNVNAREALECIVMDYETAANFSSVHDFADEYGYNDAANIYAALKRQHWSIERVFRRDTGAFLREFQER